MSGINLMWYVQVREFKTESQRKGETAVEAVWLLLQ